MNWSPAAVLLAALVVSGCAGGGSTSTTDGLVRTHGVLVRVGGPAPGAPVPLRGVTVRFVGSGDSAGVRTDRHGRFSFDVAAGRYRVAITAGGPQTDGGPIQPLPRVIHVPRGRTLRLVVSIR